MLHSAAENTLKLFLKEIIYAKALYLIPFKLRTDVFFRPFETWMKLKKLICGSTHKCLDITVFHIMPLICRSWMTAWGFFSSSGSSLLGIIILLFLCCTFCVCSVVVWRKTIPALISLTCLLHHSVLANAKFFLLSCVLRHWHSVLPLSPQFHFLLHVRKLFGKLEAVALV